MALKIKKAVGGKVGKGNSDDVKVVQGLLNRHAKVVGYSRLDEDGDVGKKTLAAIKKFQQACVTEVKPDSRVDPGRATIMTLNMSASELKAWLKGNASSDPGDAAQSIIVYIKKKPYPFTSQNAADKFLATVVRINIDGKDYCFIGKEWNAFQADMIRTLNRTIVAGARQRADMAMGVWDHFHELNNDQYVVSWFISLTGPDLPALSIVLKAKSAANSLEAAVNSGNFDKIGKAIKASEEPINKAYEVMWKYQKDVIGSAGNYLTALKIVKGTSFVIVAAIATPLAVTAAGSMAAGAAIASGGTALISSTSNELGKYAAGTSGGLKDAVKNITIDTVIDATVGVVLKGKTGKLIIEGTGKKLVSVATKNSKWLAQTGNKTAQRYVKAYIQNATESGLEEAVKQAGKLITGKTKPEDYFANIAKAMGTGGFMKSFDKVVDGNYGAAIYSKIPKKTREEIFGKMKDADAINIITASFKDKAGTLAGKGLDAALSAANGKESTKALVNSAAGHITKGSDFAKFKKILAAKAAKKR